MDKVDYDTAVCDFERICDFADVERANDTEEDLLSFEAICNKIVSGIQAGKIIVDEDGKPTLITKEDAHVVFEEPGATAYKAMDKKPDGENVGKLIAALSALTGKPPVFFTKLKKRDWKYCESMATLFLADG